MLVRIVEIYAKLKPDEQQRFEAELERGRKKEVQEMVITWEDALADSEARGIQLGLEQGLEAAVHSPGGAQRQIVRPPYGRKVSL